jgi:hypothetical protein
MPWFGITPFLYFPYFLSLSLIKHYFFICTTNNIRILLLPINNKLLLNIAATSDIKKNVIMTGRACKGASYWLTTPPNFSDNTVIEASAFRALQKYSC